MNSKNNESSRQIDRHESTYLLWLYWYEGGAGNAKFAKKWLHKMGLPNGGDDLKNEISKILFRKDYREIRAYIDQLINRGDTMAAPKIGDRKMSIKDDVFPEIPCAIITDVASVDLFFGKVKKKKSHEKFTVAAQNDRMHPLLFDGNDNHVRINTGCDGRYSVFTSYRKDDIPEHFLLKHWYLGSVVIDESEKVTFGNGTDSLASKRIKMTNRVAVWRNDTNGIFVQFTLAGQHRATP